MVRSSSLLLCCCLLLVLIGPARPLVAAEQELATPMAALSVLTHKLSLAVEAGNTELANFYLHESVALLEAVQEDIPIYETLPIALFIDRFGLPGYTRLRTVLRERALVGDAAGATMNKKPGKELLRPAMLAIIDGCNSCHEASRVGYIRILHRTNNPFNQDFQPTSQLP